MRLAVELWCAGTWRTGSWRQLVFDCAVSGSRVRHPIFRRSAHCLNAGCDSEVASAIGPFNDCFGATLQAAPGREQAVTAGPPSAEPPLNGKQKAVTVNIRHGGKETSADRGAARRTVGASS
jgi:hypothetical protein